MAPLKDSAGHALTGATGVALDAFEHAGHQLRCFIGDPVATIDRAIEAAPGMTMAHALKAWLYLLGTEPDGLPVARACIEQGERCGGDARERAHLLAARRLYEGRWREAGRILEDLSARYPRDALALQAGHQIDFFTGDSRMLRDRIARVLPAWSEPLPGYHAVLGMYAFGLEECGEYDAAEACGRRSVALEHRDGWGWHAVAHVCEMRNRADEGIAWLTQDCAAWSEDSFFAVHNWWHLALFHLDRGDTDQVLALYDGAVRGGQSGVVLDMIDASALLWRLALLGTDVGDRWQALADRWAPLATAGNYAFNDWHALMAFIGAGRRDAQQAVLESLRRQAAGGAGDIARFAREVGLPAAEAMLAFGQGRYRDAVRLLRGIRHEANRFGGSHAQRDLIDLTLLEAAVRAGDGPLAMALAQERLARRPHGQLPRRLLERATQAARGCRVPAAA